MKLARYLSLTVAAIAITTTQAYAGIIFSFTESGGNVLMQSSGTLNTANLVSVVPQSWGGVGVETNVAPQSDVMGDTTYGELDLGFGFSAGTDLSPWIGNMFTSSNFEWASSGSTQFATYYFDLGLIRTPGISISAADMVGSSWTPDISWSQAGSFASLGLTSGIYTISDFITSESISIQIGERTQSVPEPSIFALLALSLAGFGLMRKKKA